ncbi:ATP-binding cassette domain-containing protein [Patulibacter sp. SYSU D01012]|uniref:ABC transporter ATP-binding protein n=1 Tax=Patulibacter sp. SYSU D01012 TaxID=2817381 RepID=UPI001B315B7E|nr:ATP-binding cassette domain-containing protein [Patulibacter sp. SYSU D01012]
MGGATGTVPAAVAMEHVLVRRHGRDGRPLLLLEDVDWTVRRGEHWVVLGPNGAGKSTLLALAGGVSHPTSGAVHVLGLRIGGTDMRALRERIGHVDAATARSLKGGLDGRGVVLSGAFGSLAPQHRRLTDAHRARADELLALVGAEELGPRRFDDCSQGERQRLLLARALMAGVGDDVAGTGPELLLLDEPASGLDLPSRERLVGAIVATAGTTPDLPTITVTHHLEEIPPTTTHALLLRGGRVVAAGAADEVLTSGPVSACFGLEVAVERHGGRWAARLAAAAPAG